MKKVVFKIFQLAWTDHVQIGSYHGYNGYKLRYVVEDDLQQAESYFMQNICVQGKKGLLAADFGAGLGNDEDIEDVESISWDNPLLYKEMMKNRSITLLSNVCGMIVLKKAVDGRLVWIPPLKAVFFQKKHGELEIRRMEKVVNSAIKLVNYIRVSSCNSVCICTKDPEFRNHFHTQTIDFRKMDHNYPIRTVLETRWEWEGGEIFEAL